VKGKLKLVLPVLLLLVLGGGGAYWFVLKPQPAKAAPKPRVEGALLTLAPEFVVNLDGGHYGKVTVALELDKADMPAAAEGSDTPPKLEEDAAVRAVVTDDLTGLTRDDMISRERRHRLLERMLKDLRKKTDVKVQEVMFTDAVVQ
jgi:flagellar basal body-associated protein FliL